MNNGKVSIFSSRHRTKSMGYGQLFMFTRKKGGRLRPRPLTSIITQQKALPAKCRKDDSFFSIQFALLIQFTQEVWHLDAPPFPVVVDIFAPEVDPGGDVLEAQRFFDFAGVFDADFFPVALAGGDDDVAGTVFVEEPAVVQIPQIIDRRILVDVTVVVITEEITDIIKAAQGNDCIESIRMAQVEVQAVVAAHAAAGRNHRSLITGLILDVRNKFVDDITVITFVHVGAVVRAFPFAQPGFVVDAVRCVKLHQTLIDEPLAGFNHAEVRVFVVAAAG